MSENWRGLLLEKLKGVLNSRGWEFQSKYTGERRLSISGNRTGDRGKSGTEILTEIERLIISSGLECSFGVRVLESAATSNTLRALITDM